MAVIIFYYYRKGDTYEDVVVIDGDTFNAHGNNGGGDGFKGGDLGTPLGIPTSWKDVKLIRPEGLKLRVILVIPWEGVKAPRSKDLILRSHLRGLRGKCNCR